MGTFFIHIAQILSTETLQYFESRKSFKFLFGRIYRQTLFSLSKCKENIVKKRYEVD